jgi:hypothetical protein
MKNVEEFLKIFFSLNDRNVFLVGIVFKIIPLGINKVFIFVHVCIQIFGRCLQVCGHFQTRQLNFLERTQTAEQQHEIEAGIVNHCSST